MTALAESLSFISIYAYKVTAWLENLSMSLERRAKMRSTIKELSALSDKELNDIGINRGEIYSIAMECYYDNR